MYLGCGCSIQGCLFMPALMLPSADSYNIWKPDWNLPILTFKFMFGFTQNWILSHWCNHYFCVCHRRNCEIETQQIYIC